MKDNTTEKEEAQHKEATNQTMTLSIAHKILIQTYLKMMKRMRPPKWMRRFPQAQESVWIWIYIYMDIWITHQKSNKGTRIF